MRICRPGFPPIDDDPNAPKPAKLPPQKKILLAGSAPQPRAHTPASQIAAAALAEAQRAAAAMAAKNASQPAAIPPRTPNPGAKS